MTLTLVPQVRVRAHFDYNPIEDKLIPCAEAGLSFQRGDILHIVSQDDATWWQARREGGGRMRAGLIPGAQLQEMWVKRDILVTCCMQGSCGAHVII